MIENEFGEVGVDSEIIEKTDESIVEMNNGCICCTVRGDLIKILGSLKDKRVSGALKFDRVIIETTGMADPGPVAQTFFTDEDIGAYYLLDSIVTVVDAKHATGQLDEFTEAQQQSIAIPTDRNPHVQDRSGPRGRGEEALRADPQDESVARR